MEMGTASAWNMDGMGWGEVVKEKEKGKGKRKVEAKGHGQLARGQNNGRISMLVDLTYLGLACLSAWPCSPHFMAFP